MNKQSKQLLYTDKEDEDYIKTLSLRNKNINRPNAFFLLDFLFVNNKKNTFNQFILLINDNFK